MMRATMQVSELIGTLKANRGAHRELFVKALVGFRRLTIQRFEKNIALLKEGKMPETYFNLPTPQDKTKEYDRVIAMVAHHQGDTIDLTEEDYAHYVQDDWDWKVAVFATNSTYAAGATPEEDI